MYAGVCTCNGIATHHVLHADGYLVIQAKVAIESNDVWRVALMQDLQFSHDLVPYGWLQVEHNHLDKIKYNSNIPSSLLYPNLLLAPPPPNYITVVFF